MSLLLRDADGVVDVKIEISELVCIKGAIFVVNQLCPRPPTITLQPANASQIREYLSMMPNKEMGAERLPQEMTAGEPDDKAPEREEDSVIDESADVPPPPPTPKSRSGRRAKR